MPRLNGWSGDVWFEPTALLILLTHRPTSADPVATSALMHSVKPCHPFRVRKEISPGLRPGFSLSSVPRSTHCLPPPLGPTFFRPPPAQAGSSCTAPISPLHTSHGCLGRILLLFLIYFTSVTLNLIWAVSAKVLILRDLQSAWNSITAQTYECSQWCQNVCSCKRYHWGWRKLLKLSFT